jgi:hypothetical protein
MNQGGNIGVRHPVACALHSHGMEPNFVPTLDIIRVGGRRCNLAGQTEFASQSLIEWDVNEQHAH